MWQALMTFLKGLGHTFIGDIMTALPEAKQLILQGITVLVDMAIAYIEAKYGTQSASALALKGVAPMTAAEKMQFDNQRRQEALEYVKAEIAKNPSAYPAGVTDSLIYLHIEVSVQKAKTNTEGNHGESKTGDFK